MAGTPTKGSMRRRRRRASPLRDPKLLAVGGALLVALVVLIVVLATRGHAPKEDAAAVLAAQPVAAPTAEASLSPALAALQQAAADPTPTPVPTEAPSPTPGARSASERAQTRPTPTAPGFLPVFSRAHTDEKIIAITVDDCFQADNLQAMVDAAIENGAKFTIFPIGKNVLLSKQARTLKYAWENGFELENHTFSHNGLYGCSDEELAEEVYKQQLALSYILGVEYQCHFLRPMGGSAARDQRLQKYAEQLGYYGVAHWCATSGSGSLSARRLAQQVEPGAIFLFHTTDKDRDKLVRFIPWLVEQGYRLVTLNEMFGYPENETRPLAKPIAEYEIPPLESYERVYVPLRNPTYSYAAYRLQEKLVELGYLNGTPDGIYGAKCEEAVKKYQKDHGLKVTGVADEALQKALLEGAE